METTDKLEMLNEQLEAMTDQMKKMVGALGTPTPCDCCFTIDENAQNYLDFQVAIREISNECQKIAWTAYECHTAIRSAPLENALAELYAEVQDGHRIPMKDR